MYFDNLVVNHQRGPVLEQNNYYPFGMEIPGLSTKAIGFGGINDNREKYNGKELQSKEFSDGSGLTWEDFGARMYDPQIGRWMVVDPMSTNFQEASPYIYAENNPMTNVDIGGKFTFPARQLKEIQKNFPTFYNYITSTQGAAALKNSTTVIGAILKYSKWNEAALKKEFDYRSGAQIRISDISVRGNTDNVSPHNITISKQLVDLVENAKPEDKDAALLYVMMTVIHEEVHRGNYIGGKELKPNYGGGEDGYDMIEDLFFRNPADFGDYLGLNFKVDDWKDKAIKFGRDIINQQKGKDQKSDLDKANLPDNISNFIKQATAAGATLEVVF